jgi:hypothetical protein
MPLNIANASVAAGAVLPQSLSTSFVETYAYPMLTMFYNDGTFERSLITDGVNPIVALRTWLLAKRLTTAQLNSLLNFWEVTVQGGLQPFYFYDPFDVPPGARIGSNYDSTGVNAQGRVTVFFRGDWGHRTELGRHVVPSLTMIEVA